MLINFLIWKTKLFNSLIAEKACLHNIETSLPLRNEFLQMNNFIIRWLHSAILFCILLNSWTISAKLHTVFYFLIVIKSIIPLKHTKKAVLILNYKIETALENAANKPFSRASLFIFSPAVLRTQRAIT